MRLLRHGFLALSLLASATVSAGIEKGVYGRDDRVDAFYYNGTPWQSHIESVAMQVPNRVIFEKNADEAFLYGRKLGRIQGLCKGEKFREQVAVGRCSGFLVAPNVLVTAGHCITSAQDCSENSWVFGYALKNSRDSQYQSVPKENIYSCKRVISSSFSERSPMVADYAVVELDRDVYGREPLPFRTQGTVDNKASLTLVGHPDGLPMKVAPGGKVTMNNPRVTHLFRASLDAFHVNSGSPVFNSEGVVEGILVNGAADYELGEGERSNCTVVNQVQKKCPNGKCPGEGVTRITAVKGI